MERTFADINLLVLEGDAAALAKHVAELSGARVTRAATAMAPGSPLRLRPLRMSAIPYALSVHHFISTVGADAGFAAIIGLALVVLLFFAQARETAHLRERAEDAEDALQRLELYVEQVARAPRRSAPAAGARAQASRPAQTAVTRRRPARRGSPLARAGSAAPVAAGRPSAPPPVGAWPASRSPPAGVGAPALSAATRLIAAPPTTPPRSGPIPAVGARRRRPGAAGAPWPIRRLRRPRPRPRRPTAAALGRRRPGGASAARPTAPAASDGARPGRTAGHPPRPTPRPATAAARGSAAARSCSPTGLVLVVVVVVCWS